MRVDADLLRIDVEEFSFDSKFYTRCHVNDMNDRVCSLRIDSGCRRNFVSTLLVEKLSLGTLNLQNPYKLQLSKKYEEVQVTEQVSLSLSVGKYQDGVLCDVVPMETCHILLGQPWHLDRKAKIDGIRNRCTLVQDQKRVNLKLLNPLQVYEDLRQLQASFAKHREKANERESEKDKSENTSVSDENTLVSTEEKESECETLESNICLSTNDFSFPSEFDSSLQDLKEFCPQEDQDEIKLQSEFLPCNLEESKNEDSRTNLFEEGGNDVVLEASSLELTKSKFNNTYQGIGGSMDGVSAIKPQINRAKDAYRTVWDTGD